MSATSISVARILQLEVAIAWQEEYGNSLPVITNTNDKNIYPANLDFKVDKLRQATGFSSSMRFKEEAKNIFRQLLN